MGFGPAVVVLAVATVLLVPGSGLGRPEGGPNPEVRQALARVDSLLAVGSVPEAVEAARALHQKHATDRYHGWQVESRLGVALLRSGQPGEALPSLENAVRLAPAEAETHRNLGAVLLELGRRGRALAEYAQAVELSPRDPDLRLEYGQLLLDFGDRERARVHLQKAGELCPDCPAVQEQLARLYLASGRFDLAGDILVRLYRERPTKGLRLSLIQAWQGAGQDSLLLDFLGQGQVVDLPADEAMWLVELEGKLGQTRYSEAFALTVSDEDREAATVPAGVRSQAVFWGRVSYNLLVAEKNRPALAAVNRAVLLDPENVVYRNNRVVLLTRLEMHDEAAREWEKVLALDPSLKERQ